MEETVIRREENDKDRAKERFDRFIKVEHMDAESLHLKRWGLQGDEELPPTFYKIFRKGQILFPTRNPHLRRTALATFDGICGEKTLTLEPNPQMVDPAFLPFLFHSESFIAHTTSSIIGSTNPHVRWRDVAKFGFLLPPKDQQARLAELLWAADDFLEKQISLRINLETAFHAEIEHQIHGESFNNLTIDKFLESLSKRFVMEPLENQGEFLKGKGISKSQVQENGVPCVRYGELYTRHNRVIRKFYSFISDDVAASSTRLKQHDVLFAGSGETIEEIGKSAAFVDTVEAYAGSDTLIFRPKDQNGIYLGYLLNSWLVRQQLNKLGTGATIVHIYPTDLKGVLVPKRSRNDQDKIAEKLEAFESTKKTIEEHLSSSKQLQKSLINQIF